MLENDTNPARVPTHVGVLNISVEAGASIYINAEGINAEGSHTGADPAEPVCERAPDHTIGTTYAVHTAAAQIDKTLTQAGWPHGELAERVNWMAGALATANQQVSDLATRLRALEAEADHKHAERMAIAEALNNAQVPPGQTLLDRVRSTADAYATARRHVLDRTEQVGGLQAAVQSAHLALDAMAIPQVGTLNERIGVAGARITELTARLNTFARFVDQLGGLTRATPPTPGASTSTSAGDR